MFSRLVLLCLFGLLIGQTAAQERRSFNPYVEEESFNHLENHGSDKPKMVAAEMELTMSLDNGNHFVWVVNYNPEEGFTQHLYRKKLDALPLPILKRKSLPPIIFT